jgi:4-amino-4-deoxy-L-arabinose transferase-like glycosyltransferase
MPLSSKTAFALLALSAVALAARLVFCGFVVGWDRAPAGDEIDYHHLAVHLCEGQGYRLENDHVTVRRPPLYPLVLAGVYRVFGVSVVWGRLFQVLLGTSLVALVFFVGRRFFTVGVAWISAALVAVNPFLIFISAYLLTENLYIILLLASVLIPAKTPSSAGSWPRTVLMGVVFGLACLCRPTAWMVVWWVAGVGLILGGRSLMGRVVRSGVFLAAVLLTLLPWAIRNHGVFDKWIFFTSHGGITFYQGNNDAVLEYPQYYGGVAPLYMLPGYDELKSMPEIEKDDAARAMGRSFLRENKGRVPLLVWRKFVRFWRFQSDVGLSGVRSGWWWNKDSGLGKVASSLDVGFLYSVLVMPLFVLGFFSSLRNRRRFVFLAGLVVVHMFISLVFHGSLRMRIPIEPVMAMFAAETLWRVVTQFRTAASARRILSRS